MTNRNDAYFCLKYRRPLSTAANPDDASTGTRRYERKACIAEDMADAAILARNLRRGWRSVVDDWFLSFFFWKATPKVTPSLSVFVGSLEVDHQFDRTVITARRKP